MATKLLSYRLSLLREGSGVEWDAVVGDGLSWAELDAFRIAVA